MTNFIIPSIVFFIIGYGFYKNIDIYDTFLEGVKEGLHISLKIFPTIFAMLIAVNIFIKSNLLSNLVTILDPFLNIIHFPKEILPLAIMRPISGSSSLIIMNDILKTYGPDSFLGRVASVIQGSTDTTIYILSLYFSSIGIKKTKYALPVGLLADLCGIILSIIIINLLF